MDEQHFRILCSRFKTNPGEVIGELGPMVATSPDDHQAWYLLGRSLLRLGDNSAAGRAFARASELDPGNSHYIYYVGLAAKRMGVHKQGDAVVALARKQDPYSVPGTEADEPHRPKGTSQPTRPAGGSRPPGSMFWLPETDDEFRNLLDRLYQRALAERKASWKAAYAWQKIGFFVVGAFILVGFVWFVVSWVGGDPFNPQVKQCQLMSDTMSPENIPQWCKDILGR